MLGLYIHIPFCVRKCAYCDFLSFPADEGTVSGYLEALLREITACGREFAGRKADTVFIGGGTPSYLSAADISRILDKLDSCFDMTEDAEISMEMNPGVRISLKDLRKAGINRLSIGLQSFNDDELETLGRIHRSEDFSKTYKAARDAGFENINIDLMTGIPGQTLRSLEETLERVTALEPEHISAYSLIIEPGTPFYERNENGELALPGEDTEREMYHGTVRKLAENGYARYEISNFAKPGYESRHNLKYWSMDEYLGLGLGASSFMGNARWKNTDSITEYIKDAGQETDKGQNIRREYEVVDIISQKEEFMFLGLRKTAGISLEEYRRRFGKDIVEDYGNVIDKYVKTGHLSLRGDRLFLTDAGTDISNVVMSEFLFDR